MKKSMFIGVFFTLVSLTFASEKQVFIQDNGFNFSIGINSDFYATNNKKSNSKTNSKKKGNVTKKNTSVSLSVGTKAGIGLVTTGGIFILGGVGLLVFDLVYYFPLVQNSASAVKNSDAYLLYEMNYNINLALFISSLSFAGLGLLLAVISIPLFLSKKVSMNLNIGTRDNLCVSVSYKL